MLATFMEVLDTSIAAVALPYDRRQFVGNQRRGHMGADKLSGRQCHYLAGSSWFSLRFGRKKVSYYVHRNLHDFVVRLRVIHQPGDDPDCAGRARRGRRSTAAAFTINFAGDLPAAKTRLCDGRVRPGCGRRTGSRATLGGWLTDTYSWRWAFYINIPVGAFAIFMISRYVVDPPYIKDAHPRQVRWHWAGLLAVWLGALQIILDKGQEDDWFGATWIRWAAAIAAYELRAAFLHSRVSPQAAAGRSARSSGIGTSPSGCLSLD